MAQASDIERVARTLLPYLESLLLAKKRAYEQFRLANGETKQVWYAVHKELCAQVDRTKAEIETRLDILKLRGLPKDGTERTIY